MNDDGYWCPHECTYEDVEHGTRSMFGWPPIQRLRQQHHVSPPAPIPIPAHAH